MDCNFGKMESMKNKISLALQETLEVDDQVLRGRVAVVAVLLHHRLDDLAESATQLRFHVVGGTSIARRCFCITSLGDLPGNGTRPVTMCYSVAPSE